ncbi:MAG: CoA transferase [Acidimicrobiia bacterium]|nr:CoA transferase [Acidimicrobiia bacterium]
MGSAAATVIGPDLADLWELLPGPTELDPTACRVVEPTGPVAAGYRVADIAAATVGAATLAAADAGVARGRGPGREVTIETDHAIADWHGYVAVDGRTPPMWAELSGRYRAADDRFVQLHCNFPHHAAGVAARLGVDQVRDQVAAAIAGWDAFELEDVLRRDGMIAAAYRRPAEWAAHPHAAATAVLPLITVDRIGDAEVSSPDPAPGDRPLSGVKVLDCSRVLAGPVCGRTLAAHGAQVLRIGAAHLPSIEGAVLATGFGKRNAYVDLDTDDGRARFARLLREADVLVDAYRPGALAARGFSAERAADLRPGIVVIEVCAFDWVGPWAGRRGYDSIVQSTTGIALGQADAIGADEPVHLPVQALDFGTGYLAAFAAGRLLAEQARRGGSFRARLSLLRTRNWLVGLGGPQPFQPGPPADIERYLTTVDSDFGSLTAVSPVAGRWDLAPSPLGSSPAEWV